MRQPFVALLGWFVLAAFVSAQSLPDAPIPAREAPLRMTVPDGFKVTLFAGEPDVVQPIAFTFDDRGRLWVVECMSYPKWNKEVATEKGDGGRVLDRRTGTDRVLIFEDTDGDGQHDKRTVFADKLTNLSGIEYGFGGIWLCSIPNLLYIPIKPGEDKPAGPPEIKLDGWSLQSGHNAFNGLKWGPDGWLYGCNGITATSQVGLPGTPDKERTPMNCGVWRYHPTKKKFEVVAHGTTNPWGLDWDQYGELFITNCVIDHVWHVIPGGHYERMYGQDFNPHLYKLMPSIADHKHWAGGSWTDSRGGKGAHSDAGGGHAHVGCMIYQGDNWPARYRNTLFTLNLHGNRINNDILERKGSTYVAKHGKDFLMANDPWFRGIAIDYGPDGGVYVSDWCDTGECHNYQVAHTTTGRIYKVQFGSSSKWRGDLASLDDRNLLALQESKNEWFVRHTRRILQERAAIGKLGRELVKEVTARLEKPVSAHQRLRDLWLSYVAGDIDRDLLAELISPGATPTRKQLASIQSENVRAWAIRLALDQPGKYDIPGLDPLEDNLRRALNLAAFDRSSLVRLHLAGGLQRMPLADMKFRAHELGRAGIEKDAFLPLMLWYGLERLGEADPPGLHVALRLIKTPLVREYLARRSASLEGEKGGIHDLLFSMQTSDDADAHRDMLRGLLEAMKGRRHYPEPKLWRQTYAQLKHNPVAEVRELALNVAVLFGDSGALTSLRASIRDAKNHQGQRLSALRLLAANTDPELLPVLQELLDDLPMRAAALQALAAYADPNTPSLILKRYAKLTPDEKSDAISTLASRPSYALALLDAVADKTVARQDLNAFAVRQLLALNDKKVTACVNEVWGTLRPASQEKAALTAKYKKLLTADTLKQANPSHGRLVYAKNCAACHKLFGEGGAIGPELTGSQRANLDYVLENMLDPSAVVPREYQVSIITTDSGRTLTGIVKEETERAVTVQTQNEVVIVPKDEIELRRQSNLSMMPEGMFERLTFDEVRDLVAYLASPAQVPLLKQP